MNGSASAQKPLTDRYPDWLPEYEAALLEVDPVKLRERVKVAHVAITERMKALAQDHGGEPDERQAIADALTGLAMLEREAAKPHN